MFLQLDIAEDFTAIPSPEFDLPFILESHTMNQVENLLPALSPSPPTACSYSMAGTSDSYLATDLPELTINQLPSAGLDLDNVELEPLGDLKLEDILEEDDIKEEGEEEEANSCARTMVYIPVR